MALSPHSEPGYPAFEAIAKQLYGDVVDPRALWEIRKANDASEVHIDGAPDKKKHQVAGHKKTGALLLLGTVAEADAATHATRDAVKAVRTAGRIAPRAGVVGRAALQNANLGVGLVAAHALLKKPKPTPAPQPVAKGLKARMKPPVMTAEQHAKFLATHAKGTATGVRLLVGGGLLAGAGVGHHLGVKNGRSRAVRAEEAEPVAKAFRVKPLNAAAAPRVVSLKARRPAGPPPLVAKSAPELAWTGHISKIDTDKHQVFGWCSLSAVDGKPVVDLQGDFVPLDEIEKSAYKYVIESRKGGDMHRRVSKTALGDEPLHTADLIESFVVTPEKLEGMGLAPDALPHGWWVGFKVNDEEQWTKVKSGERAGFSIHGTGQRRPVAA